MTQVFQRIVVGVDGSAEAGHAIALAIRLAQTHESEVLFGYAVDYAAASDSSATVIEALTEDGHRILGNAKSRAQEAGVAARAELLEGRPEYALTRFAGEVNADAIVVGSKGMGVAERFFVGSTAEGILRLTMLPVFVAREMRPPLESTFERIVVAIDNSDPSDAAIELATKLAVIHGSRLSFCHVVDENTLYEEAANYGGATYPVLHEWLDEATILSRTAAEQAEGVGIRSVETAVLTGNPAAEILKFVAGQRADLIVVGAHGRRGLRHLLIGSVAHALVRRSTTPVLVVRTHVAAAASTVHPHVDWHGYVTLRTDDDQH